MSAALPVRLVEKVWGRDHLPPPFAAPAGKRIGEIWFEPPAAVPGLLVKYLFTSEKLSIQVHPGDAQAQAAGLGRQGKEECWLVLDAQPGAVLGIGFDRQLGPGELRAAALDGSIERLMAWHPVCAGDFFYIPAGTVHAIGPGVSLVEIQQNSDVTYRLYDYGRPRELHLDAAVAVAEAGPYPASQHRRLPEQGEAALVDGPHFRLDRIAGAPSAQTAARYAGPVLVLPLSGSATVDGSVIGPGACALAGSLAEPAFDAGGLFLVAQPCG